MSRKLIFAIFKTSDFSAIGSAILAELNKLVYSDFVFFENGSLHIQGKKQIEIFVTAMLIEIEEARSLFGGNESDEKDRQRDEDLLNSFLKIKAS